METIHSDALQQVTANVLNDLDFYLSEIDPVTYQSPLEILSGSTVGQHTRHIIEFYQCLLTQSNTHQELITINYSKRKRDFLIESDPAYALSMVRDIVNKLNDLDGNKECFLDCDEHGLTHGVVRSTISRELIYNIEHTIHHLAIVKIALKVEVPSLVLPAHFGVAPSTIRHRQEACAQ